MKLNGLVALALIASSVGLLGCKPAATSSKADSCVSDVEKVIASKESSSSDLYFDVDTLKFLDEPGLVLTSVELRTSVPGKHSHETTDITLGLNGMKLARRDGAPHSEKSGYDDSSKQSSFSFPLHKMSLNGAEPFDRFISKVREQKGRLRISLNSKSKVHATKAEVVFKGKVYNGCSSPENKPSENSGSQPLTTKIDSAEPAQSPTRSTTMLIHFSAEKKGGNFWCSLDGAKYKKCRSPQSFSDLTNGAHSFTVYSVHPGGKAEKPSATYSWVVDTVPPTATITNTKKLSSLTKEKEISFEFVGNEPGQLVCSLDGSAFEPCTSPKTYSGLNEGAHTFAVNIVDSAGNAGEAADSYLWTIDSTLPIASFTSIEPAKAVSNSQMKVFNFSANESAQFQCSVDNGPFSNCESPFELSALSEGRHWFDVKAIDLAGNEGLPSSYAYTIDLTAPQIQLGNIIPALGSSNAQNIQVEFSVDEASVVTCSFDGAPAQTCLNEFIASDVTQGSHQLIVKAIDEAGNESASAILDWNMDFTSPEIHFASISPSASHIPANSLTAQISSSESTSLEVSLNGSVIGTSSLVALSGLADGSYQLSVRGFDSVGNLSNTITHDFVVDTAAPLLTVTADSSGSITNLDRRSFTITANEATRFECNIDDSGFAACTSPLDLSGLVDGAHSVLFRAIDLAGNTSDEAQSTWMIDTIAPQVSVAYSELGDTYSFVISSDDSSAVFECALDNQPMQACSANVSYSTLEPGIHNFTARAKDSAGNMDSEGVSRQFEVKALIQTFITNLSPSAPLTNSGSMTVSFTSDVANTTFLCKLDSGAEAPCVSPATFSVGEGNHTVQVFAVNASGRRDTKGASYSWTVDQTPPVVLSMFTSVTTSSVTVTWTTSEPATSQINYGIGFTINRANAESGPFTTSHSMRLSGLSSNTQYSIQVTGRDAAGNVYTSAPRQIRTNR